MELGGREARGRERWEGRATRPRSAIPRAQAHLDDLLAAGDALVQQYVPAIESEGEWSVVLVDGVVAHALRKRPAAGDYRVQEEWGGSTERVEPGAGLAELATRVCEVLPARFALRAHRHRVARRASGT